VVGANGTIYTTVYNNGVHLIGLTPEAEPGTNQPKKIVDVVLPNDCSIRLQAYKDGIMAHGQLSGVPRYYSYSGKELGAATIGNIWYEKLNADGQLFVGKYVSGSYQSASVDMYDPLGMLGAVSAVWLLLAYLPYYISYLNQFKWQVKIINVTI